ncbi:MAG: YlbF family regulator [Syntrophomonas sp.]|nr:YlbF family regulator [Syntrophomonas sp.]
MLNQNPYDKAHELARAIQDSETYQRYVLAQKQLQQNPEAEEKIRQFRIRQMEVNQAQILGQTPADDKVTEVTLEYAKLNRDKSIAEFFNAEGLFVQMFTDIQQIIQKSIESGFTE